MNANEEGPVFVVVDELLQDGDNILFASTNRKKAFDFASSRYRPELLRVEVWDGNHRMTRERIVGNE